MAPSRERKRSTPINVGAWTDLVIKCPTQDFHVHRGLVCSKSTFFASACAAAPKSDLGHMVVEVNDKQAILEHILQYIYNGTYERGGGILGDGDGDDDDLDLFSVIPTKEYINITKFVMGRSRKQVQLHKAATKYGIPDLKACTQKLFDNSFASMFILGMGPFTAELSTMIKDIYFDAGATDLRDLMVSSIDTQVNEFDDPVSRDSFRQILEENPQLATDLVFKYMLRNT